MLAEDLNLLASVAQLNVVALIVLSVFSVATWMVLVADWRRNPDRYVASAAKEVPWGLVDLWIVVIIWFATVSLAVQFFGEQVNDQTTLSNLWSGVAMLVATLVGTAWLVFRYRRRATEWVFPTRWAREIGIGVICFLAVVPPIYWLMGFLVQFVPYHHETLDQIKAHPSVGTIWASFFAAAIVAPLGEEFFFRLLLQGWLQRIRMNDSPSHRNQCIYGDPSNQRSVDPSAPIESSNGRDGSMRVGSRNAWPILVSATFFAAMHLGQGPAPVALFLLGLALGYLFWITRSLLACITVHVLMNAYSLTWETLAAWERVGSSAGP